MASQLTFKVVWSTGDVTVDDDCKSVSLNPNGEHPSFNTVRVFLITNRRLAEKERFSFFVDSRERYDTPWFGLVEPDTEEDLSSWEERLGEWCSKETSKRWLGSHSRNSPHFTRRFMEREDFPGNIWFWNGFRIKEKEKIIKNVEAPLLEEEYWLSVCNDGGILTFTWNRSEERIPCHARAAFGFLLVTTSDANTTRHVQVSNVQSVPVEIRKRGVKAVRAFEKALLEGTVPVQSGRVMIIGQDGAGKTSLMKSLLGLPVKKEEGSTEGVEVVSSKIQTRNDNLANLKPGDCRQFEISMYKEDIAQLIKRDEHALERTVRLPANRNEELAEKEETNEENEAVKEREEDSERHERYIQEPVTGKAAASAIDIERVDLSKGLKGFKKLLDAVPTRTSRPIEAVVNIWDFAGQEVYYATHPAFLSPQAVYLLTYNLSKDLNKVAEPSARIKSHKIPLENPNKATNLDNFLSWLVSVHSIRTKDDMSNEEKDTDLKYLRPPVLVVCTHADRPFEDIETMTSHIQESIEGKRYSKHVIRPLFVVDNRSKSKKNREEISSLTRKIHELLHQEPHFSQDVPIRWFEFEKVCKVLVGKGIFHLNTMQLKATLRDFCNLKDKDDITAMLDYYQDIGLIIKHGGTVVLKPEWLNDLFRRLITVPSFDKKHALFVDHWRELERDGILTEELFHHVFDEFLEQGLSKDDILDMMEMYGLIAKFSKSEEGEPRSSAGTYFVPCQLKLQPNSLTSIVPSEDDPCPIYIHFVDGFLPHGLFPQIVSHFIAWCSSNGQPVHPKLFQNGARFFVGKKSTNSLILVSKKCFIKVVIKRTSSSVVGFSEDSDVVDCHLAYDLRVVLKEILERLTRERVWLRNMTWEECIMCPNSLVTSDKCLKHETLSDDHDTYFHLIPVQRGDRLVCDRSIDGQIICPGLDRWFLPEDEQEADECDKSRSVRDEESLFLDEAACLPAHRVPTWPSLPAQGGRVEESMQQFDPKDPDTIRLRESPYLAQTSRPIELDVRRHLPTPKVKEGTPTDEELEELAGEIGGSWEKLGRRLHFSEAKITGFDRENVLYCEKPFKMLLGWKQRDGPNASYQVLYDALFHDLVGRKDLARTFLTQ